MNAAGLAAASALPPVEAPDPTELADLSLDQLSDRYVVSELLGTGRFSQVSLGKRVNRATDAPDGRCALKVIQLETLDDDEEALEMLEAEVVALRRAAQSPSLSAVTPTLHEVLCTPEELVLVMDCVAGCELFELIDQQGALPPPVVCALMRQLLAALAELHALDIVHRDIKPENLMVSGVGPHAALELTEAAELPCDLQLHLTLIDFGYAALEEADGAAPRYLDLSLQPRTCAVLLLTRSPLLLPPPPPASGAACAG